MPYKMIDLFAGCGGLEDGFLQSGRYEDIAAVEWLQPQVKTLINRLETKWGIADAKDRVMCFDIQREDELFKMCIRDRYIPVRFLNIQITRGRKISLYLIKFSFFSDNDLRIKHYVICNIRVIN